MICRDFGDTKAILKVSLWYLLWMLLVVLVWTILAALPITALILLLKSLLA